MVFNYSFPLLIKLGNHVAETKARAISYDYFVHFPNINHHHPVFSLHFLCKLYTSHDLPVQWQSFYITSFYEEKETVISK